LIAVTINELTAALVEKVSADGENSRLLSGEIRVTVSGHAVGGGFATNTEMGWDDTPTSKGGIEATVTVLLETVTVGRPVATAYLLASRPVKL
jgi:hypothetical protein